MVRVMRCANGKISGPKIVILDSHIEVYHNWLPPLLQPIAEDRKTVVCPMIDIIDKDLRIDTYRSSGAGGQHVNTTDSAVRITHIPTKIVVQCQNERSQHKNKETCMNMLRARLYEHELQKREKQNENIESSKSDIGWGHQIRSYVLHPYQMVKDNRTNFESSNPEKILDGEIDNFLESSLYKINA